MKIAVVIKQVPDTETKVVIGPDKRSLDESSITWIVNPYDEYAIEEALKIREAQGSGEVVAVTVGPARAASALRTCLAMGVDRGIHINDGALEASDALAVASALAAVLKEFGPDLILGGQYAVGTDNKQVGVMLAELLDMPHVSVVTKLALEGTKVTAHREIEGAHEVVETSLPCVITAQKGLNEPRYASLKGIMAAKKKPIEERAAASLGLDGVSRVTVESLELPPPKQAGKVFKDDMETAVREVVRLLHEEAKVI